MRDNSPPCDVRMTAETSRPKRPYLTATRRLALSLFGLLFCFLAGQAGHGDCSSASSCIQAQTTTLPLERELSGGEVHTYRLTLNSGQFIRAVFDQRGVDVEVTLLDSAGRELLRVNNPIGVWGPEPVFFEVVNGGQYTLVVRPA